jgi:hypothetical protein
MVQIFELTSEGLCILSCEACEIDGCDCEQCDLYRDYKNDCPEDVDFKEQYI